MSDRSHLFSLRIGHALREVLAEGYSLNKLISKCQKNNTELLIADLQFQPLKTLARAGVKPIDGVLSFYPTLREVLEQLYPRAPQD